MINHDQYSEPFATDDEWDKTIELAYESLRKEEPGTLIKEGAKKG